MNVLVTSANLQTYYVGPASKGRADGSDVNNVKGWSSYSPARGDTWLLVGGTYGGKTFDCVENGTQGITIKSAGLGQCVFNGTITFLSSYWTFDGLTGGGPGNWTGPFGFKIAMLGNSGVGNQNGVTIGNGGSVGKTIGHITLRHFEFLGEGYADWNQYGVCLTGNGPYQIGDVTVSYAYFHESGCAHYDSDWSYGNIVLEFSCFGSYYGGQSPYISTEYVHAQVLADFSSTGLTNVTIRNNLILYVIGTGGFCMCYCNGLYAYGNVFYQPTVGVWESGNGCFGSLNVTDDSWAPNPAPTNWYIYNNTFINVTPTAAVQTYFGVNIVVENNLFYSSYAYLNSGPTITDYNYYNNCTSVTSSAHDQTASGNPFVNYAAYDFTLEADTNAGLTLGAPYNVDPNGVTRAGTRGAYQYVNPPV